MATLTKELVSKSGGLVSSSLVEREISWTSGGETHTATVYVKPLAFATAIAGLTGKDQAASRVAKSICNENGDPIFTVEEVEQLCESLSFALLAAIGLASGIQPVKTESRKNLNPKKKSGTS